MTIQSTKLNSKIHFLFMIIFSQQTRRYRYLRPTTPLRDNPQVWLKFAGTCILRELKSHKTQTDYFALSNVKLLALGEHFKNGFR